MENEQQAALPQENKDTSVEMTLDQLQKELDSRESLWVRIPKGEAIVCSFTGKITRRTHSFKDPKTGQQLPPSVLVDFELTDKLAATGENKVLSRNINNSDVQKIVDFLKQGKRDLMLSSDNGGKVSVAAVRGQVPK